ncbi:MAG: head fiber protein [Rhizonema sp. NSF051]|nr:head fiber protein [Rhizonema sp. NSF051]
MAVTTNNGWLYAVNEMDAKATAGTLIPAATTTVNGSVKKAATQANSTATDVAGLVADFNALLAKLKAAGIMA